MRNVLIPTKLNPVAAELLTKDGFQVVQDSNTDLATLVAANPETNALIVRSEQVTAEIIDALPQLRVVVRAGAGYNTIDHRYARRRGIDVMNTPGANANAVAEEVIAMVLAAYRKLIPGDISTRAGKWEKKSLMGRELTGKTIGIIGLGNIGQLVVKRLQGFETQVLGFDPMISAERAKSLDVKLCDMETIFAQCDIITLHIPETDETRGIINSKLFNIMKDGAVLVNCARSGIINEDDLRDAKAERNLVFCNDVYPKDEAGPKSVTDIADIMLPHVGANTEEANATAARRAAEQVIAYINRGVAPYVVNRALPEGLDEKHQLLAFYLAKLARVYLGCGNQPKRIQTSLYGELKEYANWLTAPIVSGISADFDPYFDFNDASDYLNDKGIALEHRTPDDSKDYGESITLDFDEGSGSTYNRVSVRGTLTEGRPMISRIDGFDRLYFDPKGYSVIAVYEDQPGMLAKITLVIAHHGINIDDIRCPQDHDAGEAIAILKVNQAVEQVVIDEIQSTSGAKKVVFLHIK